jgi:hypothetical protein
MAALPYDSARPFNRKIGFVYANYFANHFHNAAFHPSYFLDQLVQSHKMKNPQPVEAERTRLAPVSLNSPPVSLYGSTPCRNATEPREVVAAAIWRRDGAATV